MPSSLRNRRHKVRVARRTARNASRPSAELRAGAL